MPDITFPLSVDFCGQNFRQLPGCVIPAVPQSAHFAACAVFVQHLRTLDYASVLDLGAGSGLLGISLWREGVELVMTDLNPQAVALAQENSRLLGVPSRCLQGSWFEPVEGQYDLVIANPPHGTSREWEAFTWAHSWVPQISVDGGSDGLDSVRAILARAGEYTRGLLCIIYSKEQHSQVLALAADHGFVCDQVLQHQESAMGCFLPAISHIRS